MTSVTDVMSSWVFADVPLPKFSKPFIPLPPRGTTEPPTYCWVDHASSIATHKWHWDNMEADQLTAISMTEEQFLLWAVLNVHGQIGNGGFDQMLSNSYGQLAEEAVLGFRHFGMNDYANSLETGLDFFPIRPVPRDRNVRNVILVDIGKNDKLFKYVASNWNETASAIYRLDRDKTYGDGFDDGFYRRLAEWIEVHPNRFFV